MLHVRLYLIFCQVDQWPIKIVEKGCSVQSSSYACYGPSFLFKYTYVLFIPI